MAQDTTIKKMVVAQCDPYNARFHHHYERVLEYDVATPVKWVIEDGYGCGISEDKALATLEKYASMDGYDYYDEAQLVAWVQDFKEAYEYENDVPFEGDVDTSWYEGRGYYDSENLICVYLCGSDYYRHDTMFYSIEDFVADDNEAEEE